MSSGLNVGNRYKKDLHLPFRKSGHQMMKRRREILRKRRKMKYHHVDDLSCFSILL
jgi:hypothetical protein